MDNYFMKISELSKKYLAEDVVNPFIMDLPYTKLNDALKGIHKGDLTLLESRPSMGTTTFCVNLAVQLAKQKLKIAYITLDISPVEIARRFEACMANFSDHKPKKTNTKKKVEDLEIYINTYRSWYDADIVDAVWRMSRDHKIDLFILDFIQLLGPIGGEFSNSDTDILSYIQAFKHRIRSCNTSMIVVSKLVDGASNNEQMTPSLQDCYIDWSTDNVIVLDRPEKYFVTQDVEGNSTENKLYLHIYKNKYGTSAEKLKPIDFEIDLEKQIINEL